MRVINRSLSERGGNAASEHVVQVLVLLAVEDVVVDDLEASEARARRGPPMNARSLQRIRGAVPTWPSRPWLASALRMSKIGWSVGPFRLKLRLSAPYALNGHIQCSNGQMKT